ncbi:MAG: sulfate adenylyltransferase [candidate division Zixibacteria bacterium]|nr:sulfate adenylyltransferase [candidate division Zixibacteria bacterium]MBU1470741.1 sulfate adenylyltransferase [candidate division Zixibacteria bacterium]MBU2624499.1 sulfate adenylyltransferase [candidate division Zixibacteria bacterium]
MAKSDLISPHGSDKLKILMLDGEDRKKELKRAEGFPKLEMTTRETGDLIMLGIGGFTPLEGFMGEKDWKGVCADMKMSSGLFWPIPITLSHDEKLAPGTEICLVSGETKEIMGTMKVTESYQIDKDFECKHVFKTTDDQHPGVQMVKAQKAWNIAGPVKVLSESYFVKEFADVYQRPAESRAIFAEKGWKTVAALQLRNPMHRSHEYLAKIACEVSDGIYIHQLVGKLKPGDIPADVRVDCINTLVENYFVKDRVVTGGYPLDMRYAGPREGLLHALFRQNFGCTHMIIGRDHAGVGDYYGPFDAQQIFFDLWDGALKCKMLPIDWTFWCYKCGGMVSMKTCPHGKEDRLFLSGTALRKALSEEGEVPAEFSRPEILSILREYYAGIKDEDKVEVKMHGHATGEAEKKIKK